MLDVKLHALQPNQPPKVPCSFIMCHPGLSLGLFKQRSSGRELAEVPCRIDAFVDAGPARRYGMLASGGLCGNPVWDYGQVTWGDPSERSHQIASCHISLQASVSETQPTPQPQPYPNHERLLPVARLGVGGAEDDSLPALSGFSKLSVCLNFEGSL